MKDEIGILKYKDKEYNIYIEEFEQTEDKDSAAYYDQHMKINYYPFRVIHRIRIEGIVLKGENI